MITTEELARIRAAAVGDMLGDSKALDEMGPGATIFRLCQEIKRLEREADVLSIWLANAYIDIDLMPDIDSDAMNPPLPEDVREAAREAVRKNAARIWVLAELLAISGGCKGCTLRELHSCQDIVSRKLCWIKKADEIIKRREAVGEGEESCPKN